MTIYQTATNRARYHALITGFRAFEQTKLYDLLAATPLIAWYSFVLSVQVPRIAHQISSLDHATADTRVIAALASKVATQVFFWL